LKKSGLIDFKEPNRRDRENFRGEKKIHQKLDDELTKIDRAM
jgi:hypothetical protein